MKKVYFIVTAIVVFILVIYVTYSFLQKPSPSTGNNLVLSPTAAAILTGTQTQVGTGPLSPDQVTKIFYSWYMSYPSNPLTSGAYKTSIYLSDGFKQQTAASLNSPQNGYDPVFCTINKTPDVTVGQPSFNNTGDQATVEIMDMNGKNLYKVLLALEKNKWVIDDTMCEP